MIKETTQKRFSIKNLKITTYALGILTSLIVALSLIFVFALIIRYANVSNKAITPVNIIIKIISIAFGTFVATKDGTKGLIKGVVVGFCFTILCFCIFSIIAHSFSINIMFLIDVIVGIASGAISGILSVNIRKK